MIQDIGENIFRNEFALHRAPAASDRVIVYRAGEMACAAENNTIAFPQVCELTEKYAEKLIYLFEVEGEGFFLLLTGEETVPELPEKYSFGSIRKIRSTDPVPQKYLFAGFTAHHLAEWYLSSRFCGRCGGENVRDESERAMLCPKCGKKVFAYPKSYSCESGKDGCGFVIWKTVAGKEISQAQAEKLLTKGKSDIIKGFTSKAGKKFDARLKLNSSTFAVEFEFENKGGKKR